MKKITIICLLGLIGLIAYSQNQDVESALERFNFEKDSTLMALFRVDSIKVAKQYNEKIKEAKFKAIAIYPALNAGLFSGVVPVKKVTEIPDPTLDYKLMFELVQNNPDSISGANAGMVEIARVINLHVASGIPVEKIFPVIVIHGPVLNAFTSNEFYNEKFKTDNPNLKLISDLEALGTKFIACGQAMYYFDIKDKDLLSTIKVALTAQTILSSYRLKGYLKFW